MAGIFDDVVRAIDALEARQEREAEAAQSAETNQLGQMLKALQVQKMLEELRPPSTEEIETFSKIAQEDRKLDIESTKAAAGRTGAAARAAAPDMGVEAPVTAEVSATLGAGVRAPSRFAAARTRGQLSEQLKAEQAGQRLGQAETRLTQSQQEAQRREGRFRIREERISSDFAVNFGQREQTLDRLQSLAVDQFQRSFVAELRSRGTALERAATLIREGLDRGEFPSSLKVQINSLLPKFLRQRYPDMTLAVAQRALLDLELELINVPQQFPRAQPRGGGPRGRTRTKSADQIDAELDAIGQ